MRTALMFRVATIALVWTLIGATVRAQPTKLPTADEVKELQSLYRAERDRLVKEGIAKRFLPTIMEKAEELAKKSDQALASGRLAQATEAIRQARWQLPYQPVGLPEHTLRVIGNLRLRHAREINAVAYSPDGTKLATASTDGTIKIWDLGNGHELFTFMGHSEKVRCLAWSGDGRTMASAGSEKQILVWDPKTGKTIQTIAGAGNSVSALALSNDSKHVFAGQFEIPNANPPNGFFVYEASTGKLVRDARDFTNKIGSIAVHPDGNIIATGDDNGNMRLWQYPSFVENVNQPAYWAQQDPGGSTVYQLTFSPDGKTLTRLGPFNIKFYNVPLPGAAFQVAAARQTIDTREQKAQYRAVYSRDGKTLYTGGYDGNIYLWDPENAQLARTFKNAHNSPVNGLVFNPSGNQLASCSGDFIVRLWDFDVVLQSRDFEGHDAPAWTAYFSPDGTKLISASGDRTVKVWHRDTGTVAFTISDHTSPVTCALFSPDGKLIASAGGDKVVRIFDAENGKALRTCEGHQGTITFLDFSADSKKIVSCGADRRIKVWNADTAKEILSINDNPSIVSGVSFSPNGNQIAVANIDQTIRLYDAASGKMQHSWNAHGTSVNGVAYSPDGTMLASCGADTAVVVWPLATPGVNSIRLNGHTGPVSSVAFRKDNQHLVSCGADQLVKLWKLEAGAAKEMQTFRGHKDWVTNVAFSKDGYHVVSSSVDRRLKIWEITSKEIPLLAEHTSAVECVAVSPNGKIVATGSVDRTIKLWDRDTGVELGTLAGHKGAIMNIAFTPDSKRLLSTDDESSIKIWEVTPPREVLLSPQQKAVFDRLRIKSPYIAVDPAGKSVFVWLPVNSTSISTWVEAFDIDTGAFLFDFKEETRKVNSLSFCANGKQAATGGKNGSVLFWQMDAKDPKGDIKPKIADGGELPLFKVGVADLALTPDGATLVATSEDGEIKIVNVAKREVVKTFKGHANRIMACIASPDGKRFATVDAANLIKVWNIDGTEVRAFNAGRHNDMFIINLAFTNDSKQLVTANANTTVYVLDLP
jgi:WD40 repeat protein